MITSREAFLQRVRQAAQAGNRPGSGTREPRGRTGYQGAGPDPVARFCQACAAVGGQAFAFPDREAAAANVVERVQGWAARKVLVGRGPFFDTLGLPERLRALGVEVLMADTLTPEGARDPLFAAEVGISGVDYLVAETGTVVLKARPGEPRSLSLLPPVHIAVAHRGQLLADLFDLFEALSAGPADGAGGPALPSCLTLITGPSKTGDIELRLVTGVHGPGELFVLLVDH
jgi:L-lactate dehydrogenase complex protein LldG